MVGDFYRWDLDQTLIRDLTIITYERRDILCGTLDAIDTPGDWLAIFRARFLGFFYSFIFDPGCVSLAHRQSRDLLYIDTLNQVHQPTSGGEPEARTLRWMLYL